jgi:hypothetical protein
MGVKKCSKCQTKKSLSDFHKASNHKDGYRNDCKSCALKYHRKHYLKNIQRMHDYSKTRQFSYKIFFIFFIRRMFSYMQSRVRGFGNKAHYGYYINLPICDRKIFYKFAFRNWQLKYLYHNWILSGYKKQLLPTPDRIFREKGYTLDNIQFLTFSDNVKKSHVH